MLAATLQVSPMAAVAATEIQMLPPYDEGQSTVCAAGSSRVLTWDGASTTKCAQGVTASGGDVVARGTVTVGGASEACTNTNIGAIRFNPASGSFEGCGNGSSWQPLGGVLPGTLCGSVFWETDQTGVLWNHNIQNYSNCNGTWIMRNEGGYPVATCPHGYTFAYTLGNIGTFGGGNGQTNEYHMGSCAACADPNNNCPGTISANWH